MKLGDSRREKEVGGQSKNVDFLSTLIRQKISTQGGGWSKKAKILSTQLKNAPIVPFQNKNLFIRLCRFPVFENPGRNIWMAVAIYVSTFKTGATYCVTSVLFLCPPKTMARNPMQVYYVGHLFYIDCTIVDVTQSSWVTLEF